MIIIVSAFCFFALVWFNAVLTTDKHPFVLRMVHKPWLSTDGALLRYDKAEHLLGTFALTFFLYRVSMNQTNAFISALIFGFSWEVKDSFFPCEVYGWIGGDGADWKDFTADVIGAVLAVFIINWAR